MNILRTLTILAFAIILTPIGVYAHCNGKHTGDHEHCTGGGDDGGSDEYTGSAGVQFISPSDVGSYDYHIVGTTDGDTIIAGSGSDLIEGDDGEDSIDPRDGDDDVYAGAGDDIITVGLGVDWLDGGPGTDNLIIGSADHGVVDLVLNTYQATFTDASGTAVLAQGTLSSIEYVRGSGGNDVLSGNDSDNVIGGGDGDDFIYGLGGNDSVGGSLGNDVVDGGPGSDVVSGSMGADMLYGGGGNDILQGGDDGWGDVRDDMLWGGSGCDVFEFRGEFGTDTVMDYEACEQIDLSGYIGGFWRNDLTFSVLNINEVGDDIVVDFWLVRGGGTGGTIILKDAAANEIVVDESDFIFE